MPKQAASYFLIFFVLFSLGSIAQEVVTEDLGDQRYREDQFYVSATYNLLSNVPNGVNIRGLSGGFQFGYLRDTPLNAQRNVAIAFGVGLSFDEFGQTLFIGETPNEETVFAVLDDDVDYSRNRFNTSTIEFPLEFRWRTSTASTYKFWRVYGGLRAGYVYWYKSTFIQDGNDVSQTDIPEFERLRLGATLSFGFNTFNFFVHYTINPFFKDAIATDSQPVKFQPIRMGLIFYIL